MTIKATVPAEDRSEFICIGSYRLRVTPTILRAWQYFRRDTHSTSATDALNYVIYDGLSLNGYLPIVKARSVTICDFGPEIERRIQNGMRLSGAAREAILAAALDAGLAELEREGFLRFEEQAEGRKRA